MNIGKQLTAGAAAALVKDGDTVAISGNGAGMSSAEAIFAALETRFLQTGHPQNLTLVHSLGLGDRGEMGTNRFAHVGMLKRVIAAHFTWSARIQQMIKDNQIEAYCFPGGVVQHLLREIGSGRPGLFTHSGLGTFVDPRNDGGRCNDISRDTLIEVHQIDGKDVLRYKPFRVDVAIVRGTYADTRNNISTEEEAIDLDVYTIALAARNSGGIVLGQVKQIVESGTLHPRSVRIPGIMVDVVVEDKTQQQFYGLEYDSTVGGGKRAHLSSTKPEIPTRLERRIIARRAAAELVPGESTNFGFGIPGGIFAVIAEQGKAEELWISVEQGVHNGAMLDDRLFGAARNPDAIISSVEQFDYYSGGGIDLSFLGMGEMDGAGNVNVSHLGGSLVGPGGFMEIAQNAKKVVFCGTFDAKGGKLSFHDGQLEILKQGEIPKLVGTVERITFSGAYAQEQRQQVMYVTERAVFVLTAEGVELKEVAPGIIIERDILPYMGFTPIIKNPTVMKAEFFI
jgi:propionate CoA-transferase